MIINFQKQKCNSIIEYFEKSIVDLRQKIIEATAVFDINVNWKTL